MTPRRLVQLVLGCAVLGVGVALLLTPALGSDGFSTIVTGVAEASGMAFVLANAIVAATFVGVAWLRGLRPGVGTLTQIVVVGAVADVGLRLLDEPDALWLRILMVLVAFPVLATGIALYLGTHLGAGPAEAPALAWDPPVPFRWSYSVVQGGGALAGWALGAPIGPGTVAVILLLGPVVDLTARLLRLDIAQSP
ncbi:YczE/YyaS/YitT family protein [Nocardioides caldifontis]|uniref:YczE/YyaS/YitT family protein n=1 Tax=Nocardioides caldifontis TaxID=2588938 RepID=UPI0011E00BA3|nr:hypothetical protein [Nocardioides caldifontis]